jgi:hypothetical protein
MQKIVWSFVLITALNSYSQELKFTNKLGYAVGESNTLKKVMLCTQNDLGVEINIKDRLFFCSAVGVIRLRFDNSDTGNSQVFNTHYYLTIPFSVKKYYPVSKKSSMFWDFGAMVNYHLTAKMEIRSAANYTVQKQGGSGFILGLSASFGFKTRITETISFDIGIHGQSDLLYRYRNNQNKIETEKNCLAISFYKKL